jgi:hypothetical protein
VVGACFGLALLPDELEVTSEYPTLAAAVQDDAVRRGWLPPFLPDSAVNIRIYADLDTNWFAIRFLVPLSEADHFIQVLRENGFTPYVGETPSEPGVFSAWRAAEGLPRPLTTAPSFQGRHHVGGDPVFVVVDSRQGYIYYWHQSLSGGLTSGCT